MRDTGCTYLKIVEKCKKVLNITRCLVASGWGACRNSLKAIYTNQVSIRLWVCITYFSSRFKFP